MRLGHRIVISLHRLIENFHEIIHHLSCLNVLIDSDLVFTDVKFKLSVSRPFEHVNSTPDRVGDKDYT